MSDVDVGRASFVASKADAFRVAGHLKTRRVDWRFGTNQRVSARESGASRKLIFDALGEGRSLSGHRVHCVRPNLDPFPIQKGLV